MGQASQARGLRRTQFAAAAALALAGTSAAVAADFKVVDGVIQFPNVVVINAPQANSAPAAPQGGMRAYRDSADAPLRGPSTEEMQTASAKAPAASPNARRATAATDATAAPSEAPGFASAGGGVGVALDESTMQYSVLVRDSDGTLREICVTGKDMAAEVVRNPAAAKAAIAKEASNVR